MKNKKYILSVQFDIISFFKRILFFLILFLNFKCLGQANKLTKDVICIENKVSMKYSKDSLGVYQMAHWEYEIKQINIFTQESENLIKDSIYCEEKLFKRILWKSTNDTLIFNNNRNLIDTLIFKTGWRKLSNGVVTDICADTFNFNGAFARNTDLKVLVEYVGSDKIKICGKNIKVHVFEYQLELEKKYVLKVFFDKKHGLILREVLAHLNLNPNKLIRLEKMICF